jgi:hypothetical protein
MKVLPSSGSVVLKLPIVVAAGTFSLTQRRVISHVSATVRVYGSNRLGSSNCRLHRLEYLALVNYASNTRHSISTSAICDL